MLRTSVKWAMNILFVVIPAAVGVTIWIGLPIAAWNQHWGHYWICSWQNHGSDWVCSENGNFYSNHPLAVILMGIFWGIPLFVGLIYGLRKMWKWSHSNEDTGITEANAEGGTGTIEVNVDRS